MHDRVVDRLGSDHADATHPPRIIVRHDVFALDRMDQRRFHTIRERTQLLAGAMATGAAHNYDAVCHFDAAGDIDDVLLIRNDLGRVLQGRDARYRAVGFRFNDILRQSQVSNASPRIGSRNRLMNDRRA